MHLVISLCAKYFQVQIASCFGELVTRTSLEAKVDTINKGVIIGLFYFCHVMSHISCLFTECNYDLVIIHMSKSK